MILLFHGCQKLDRRDKAVLLRRTCSAAPPLPEAPFHLRFFSTAVKTDSRGRIITGPHR
jgi:hypothetical protein